MIMFFEFYIHNTYVKLLFVQDQRYYFQYNIYVNPIANIHAGRWKQCDVEQRPREDDQRQPEQRFLGVVGRIRLDVLSLFLTLRICCSVHLPLPASQGSEKTINKCDRKNYFS